MMHSLKEADEKQSHKAIELKRKLTKLIVSAILAFRYY